MASSNVSAVTSHFPTANEGFTTTLSSTILSGATTVPLNSTSGLTNGTVFVGIIEPGQAKEQTFTGIVDTGGAQITGVKWTRGTNADHTAGVTIVDYVSGTGNNMFTKGLLVSHDQDGTLKAGAVDDTAVLADAIITPSKIATGSSLAPTGSILPYVGRTAPTDWLLCFGQAVSRTTYSTLFNVISPSVGTFTVTIATPGVFTLAGHGLITGDQIYITTTGALPTGLSINTLYYVIFTDANTFRLATTRANAVVGTAIATSGTQSGTHTMRHCPYGLGDGTTTFNIPDARGRVVAGADAMGGTAASRLSLGRSEGSYGQLGASGGAQSHTMAITEMPAHTHNPGTRTTNAGADQTGTGIPPHNASASGTQQMVTDSTGGGNAHNNVQPTLVTNYIIRT
jgi:microcystin-dependent protein